METTRAKQSAEVFHLMPKKRKDNSHISGRKDTSSSRRERMEQVKQKSFKKFYPISKIAVNLATVENFILKQQECSHIYFS